MTNSSPTKTYAEPLWPNLVFFWVRINQLDRSTSRFYLSLAIIYTVSMHVRIGLGNQDACPFPFSR
jgi:hypothetical protein